MKRSITKRFTREAHWEVHSTNVARPRRVKAYRAVSSCQVVGGLFGHLAKGSAEMRSWLKTSGCVRPIQSRRAHNCPPPSALVRPLGPGESMARSGLRGGAGTAPGRIGAPGGSGRMTDRRARGPDRGRRGQRRPPPEVGFAAGSGARHGRGAERKTGRSSPSGPSQARVRHNRHCHRGPPRACSPQRHACFCGGLGSEGVTPYPWGYGVGKMIPGQSSPPAEAPEPKHLSPAPPETAPSSPGLSSPRNRWPVTKSLNPQTASR